MVKARKLGVHCPTLLHVDVDMSSLYLEKVEGKSVKDLLFEESLDEAGQ